MLLYDVPNTTTTLDRTALNLFKEKKYRKYSKIY